MLRPGCCVPGTKMFQLSSEYAQVVRSQCRGASALSQTKTGELFGGRSSLAVGPWSFVICLVTPIKRLVYSALAQPNAFFCGRRSDCRAHPKSYDLRRVRLADGRADRAGRG